jgi:outer membrane protein assembly factor BamB
MLNAATRVVTAVCLVCAPLLAQPSPDTWRPRWTKTFANDFWVVNTSVGSDYGVRWRSSGMPSTLATMDAVDTAHGTLVLVVGRPDRAATIVAVDADTGATLWQRTDVRLARWRPFASYVPARSHFPAYFAQVFGNAVLLAVTPGVERALGCADGRRLLALDLRDGRLLWCSGEVPAGDVTYVAVPERNMLIAWAAGDRDAAVLAIDVRTGRARWQHALGLDGSDWLRLISYMTALPADDATRPDLYHDGRIVVIVGAARRIGPVMRPPEEAAIRLLDADSGQVLAEVRQPLAGSRTWLSWRFSGNRLIVSTGEVVSAYDVTSGERAWTTPLKDVRSVRLARGARSDVLLVDFDGRNFMLRPTREGRGLAALDPASGALLWRDEQARVLHSLERVNAAILLRRDDETVLAVDVDSGREVWRARPGFEEEILFARRVGPDRIVVQSPIEIAAYDGQSQVPAYRHVIPSAFRGGVTRIIVTGVLAALFGPLPYVTLIVGGATLNPGGLGLWSREIPPAAEHAFFATGSRDRSHVVAVDLRTGTQQPIAPYVFGDPDKFSLGNLLDEAHGAMYTVDDRTLAAYPFAGDESRHRVVHRTADMSRALELHDRADALHRAQQTDAGRREAALALDALRLLGSRPGLDQADQVLVRKAEGDTHALLASMSPATEAITHRLAAAGAYAQALELLPAMATTSPPDSIEALRADIEQRRARVQPPQERRE